MGWILSFAVAATIAGQSVGDEQVAHWSQAKGGELQAFEFLVEANWTEQEALQRGVVVAQRDAEEAAEGEKPKPGLTHQDVVYEERLTLLTAGIHEQIGEPAAKSVTPDQVRAYVEANPKVTPERRKIRLVRARTRKEAMQAERAIRQGLTWKQAARRYGSGGTTTVDPGDFPKATERAIFDARRNTTVRASTIVFRVTQVIAPRPVNRAVQEAQGWETLTTQAQLQAIAVFTGAFQEKWRAQTVCAPEFQASKVCAAPPIGQEAG